MAYAMAYSPCLRCGIVFGYNPNKVPSFRVEGKREPVCSTCIDVINLMRLQKGLDAFVWDDDAYEPIHESEL